MPAEIEAVVSAFQTYTGVSDNTVQLVVWMV